MTTKPKTQAAKTTVECINNDGASELVVGQSYEVCCEIGRFYYFGECKTANHYGWRKDRFK